MTLKTKFFIFTLFFIFNLFSIKAQNIVIKNPEYDKNSALFRLVKIEHSKKYTILNIVWKGGKSSEFNGGYGKAKISNKIRLRDYDTGKEYPLLEVDNIRAFTYESYMFKSSDDSLSFSLLFDRIPDDIEKVRLTDICPEQPCLRLFNILVHPTIETPISANVISTKAVEVKEKPKEIEPPSPIYNFTLESNTFTTRDEETRLWSAPAAAIYKFQFQENGTVTISSKNDNFTLKLGGILQKFKNPKNVDLLIQQYLCKSDGDIKEDILVLLFKKTGEIRLLNLATGVQNTFSTR